MAAIRTTKPRSQMFKYMEAMIEAVEASMGEGKTVDSSDGSFRITESKANRDALAEFVKLVAKKSDKSSTEACNIKLQVAGGKSPRGGLSMGNLDKPSKPSKGDIGEAVIAAAICARFVYKHGRVTPQMVIGIMKTLGHKGVKAYPGKTGKFVENTFKSKNEGVKILDDVQCYISLNKSAITAALNPRSEFGIWAYKEVIPAYARSACNYVNSGKVSRWAETVYKNRRYDLIDIRSDGLGDQKGTKVDTRVKITNQEGKLEPVNINLSMKVDDVKQFGQVSGMEFSVQQELWNQLFGYTSTVNTLETKWNELSQEKHDLPGALNMVYDAVYTKAKADLKGAGKEKLVQQIAQGITYFATRHEEHVELLNLGKGGTKLYNFDDFYTTLMSVEDLDVTIRDQKNNLRQMEIVGKSPKDQKVKTLIGIRIRREPEASRGAIVYIRNLIEKSHLLGDLLAESLD